MPWPGCFAFHGRNPAGGKLCVARTAAQWRTQVGLGAGEQTVADLAVGGQADSGRMRRRTVWSQTAMMPTE